MRTPGMARTYARVMQKGLTRIGGDPRTAHTERVAELVRLAGGDDAQITAAYLHDIVEDTSCELGHLEAAGFGEQVVGLVDALTRRDTESYWQYLDRLLRTPGAALVKRADIIDNMMDDPRSGMSKRYAKSISIVAPDIWKEGT